MATAYRDHIASSSIFYMDFKITYKLKNSYSCQIRLAPRCATSRRLVCERDKWLNLMASLCCMISDFRLSASNVVYAVVGKLNSVMSLLIL